MSSRLQPSTIPLNCNICPKKPDFSDVSHLLTHIASKAHLSTYYKIKVKASSEDASRQIIEQYDSWYAHWCIEDLMSERLNLKDKRKPKPRGTASVGNVHSAPLPLYQVPQAYVPFPNHVPYDLAVDPRLAPHPVKTEAVSRGATPVGPSYFGLGPVMFPSMQNPYADAWAQPPYPYMQPRQNLDDEASSEASLFPSMGMMAETQSYSMPMAEDDGEAEEIHETSKLKGVFWPGMDMFDAAPEEQRRKRNQKKDTSVVKQLEAMSQMIEATEHVFSPLGTHCKSRPISGLPDSDDNPLPGEETPPRPKKPKRAARRKPLAEKDVNTGRKRPTKPQNRGRRTKPSTVAVSDHASQAQGSAVPAVQPRRKRKGLSVYRDADEVTFERPADMNVLTSGFYPGAQYQRMGQGAAALASFVAGETGPVHQQGYHTYSAPTYHHTAAFETNPSWDDYAHDPRSQMISPFSYIDQNMSSTYRDDDEETISNADSDE